MGALNVSHGRMNAPGGLRVFREVRGLLAETCRGVLVGWGSSRASPERGLCCAQNQLGETCASYLSLSYRGRRNDVARGLPSDHRQRRLCLRVACVGRGLQILPNGVLSDRLVRLREA